MSFNPTKGDVIRITKKRNPIQTTYQIHNHDLTITKAGKYLRITISNNLPWNTHVNATVKKANNSLALLKRNLARCPKDVKAQSYQTYPRLRVHLSIDQFLMSKPGPVKNYSK